ncbi:hypothetical protein KW792_01670 [Candidatus Saccharibacteria bacterium]|nr:hypothetical protein [Candidatus Saccharibacteria bacterium]
MTKQIMTRESLTGTGVPEELKLSPTTAMINWAELHTGGDLQLLPHEPEANPFQELEVIHLKPRPNLELAAQVGEIGLGQPTYGNLISQIQISGLVGEAYANALESKNTLIATAHFKNILDTPASHNALFVASEDEAFADRNVIVANHMVKWLQVNGVPVVDILRTSGHVVFGSPYEGSLAHKIDSEVIQAGNRALQPVFKGMLERGMVFHMALTETRAKKIIMNDGKAALMIPRIQDSLANMVKKRMSLAAALTMDIGENNKQAELTDFIYVNDVRDIHHMMMGSANKLCVMSGEQVVYGMPDGASLVEV